MYVYIKTYIPNSRNEQLVVIVVVVVLRDRIFLNETQPPPTLSACTTLSFWSFSTSRRLSPRRRRRTRIASSRAFLKQDFPVSQREQSEILPVPTPGPAWNLFPNCRTMMFPGDTFFLGRRVSPPRYFGFRSRPFLTDPVPFFVRGFDREGEFRGCALLFVIKERI